MSTFNNQVQTKERSYDLTIGKSGKTFESKDPLGSVW